MTGSTTSNQALLNHYLALSRAENQRALEALDNTEWLSPAEVHELRVISKRLRAWWRLLQPFCGRKNARRADRDLRDTARLLAGARDLHVMRKTLTQLQAATRRDYEKAALEAVSNTLYPLDEQETSHAADERLHQAFKRDLVRWQALALDIDDERLIREGLTRTYRKARTLGFQALTGEAPEPWHRFRKWVKYLFYQMDPLSETIGRDGLHPQDLNKLGKKLGKLHDLHVLLEDLHQREREHADKELLATAIQVIRREEANLLEDCQKGARNCFRAKPKAFRKQVLNDMGAEDTL